MPSSQLTVLVSFVLLIFVSVPVLVNASSGDANSTESRRGQRNGCENMSEDEVEANAYRLFIGVLIAIAGGLVSSFGLVFQKYAHKLNEALPLVTLTFKDADSSDHSVPSFTMPERDDWPFVAVTTCPATNFWGAEK